MFINTVERDSTVHNSGPTETVGVTPRRSLLRSLGVMGLIAYERVKALRSPFVHIPKLPSLVSVHVEHFDLNVSIFGSGRHAPGNGNGHKEDTAKERDQAISASWRNLRRELEKPPTSELGNGDNSNYQ